MATKVPLPPQDEAEKTNGDWTTPPSPPPEDRLPKRSKLDDLVESSSTPITITIPRVAPSNNNNNGNTNNNNAQPYTPLLDGSAAILAQMEQQAHLARLERKKTEMAAIIAAAAAAQQAEEQRALLEAAAAAEARCKEEERIAERERRKRERKEREEGGGGRRAANAAAGDNREKRLLKLVGAVVVKTMSKYRGRMDVDTFKKHAKEVRSGVLYPYLANLARSQTHSSRISSRRKRRNRLVSKKTN